MPTRPITGPLTRSPSGGVTEIRPGGAFSPSASFFAGSQGFAYDLSDASKLYVDSARTVQVATAGDLIGSVSDLSGNGNHASQGTTASKPAWQTTYAAFDGFDDFWSTASMNFTATDKVTVVVGLNKASDAATAALLELSANSSTTAGTFAMFAPVSTATKDMTVRSGGTTPAVGSGQNNLVAPVSLVTTMLANIAGPSVQIRVNGAASAPNTATQGAGSFGNYPAYVGRRAGTSLPFNGRIYRIIVIGRLLNATELAQAERWCNTTTGAY